MMKEELCTAFCEGLEIVKVPIGFAVGTNFKTDMGDNLAFYVCGPDKNDLWYLQDDGTTVPYIEASGADLSVAAREEAFQALLADYGAVLDTDTLELKSRVLDRADVPASAMQFVALLLRVQDLALLSTERVHSTWVEEATRMLTGAVAGRATVDLKAAVFPDADEFPADLVLRSEARPPVAVFFGVSDTKIYEALLLQSYAKYQVKRDCEVVVILEEDGAVTKKARQRADNHLIVPRFKGGKSDAIGRIVEVATGSRPEVMH
ncbi:MAG: DUF1828 domain-containing protein [Rhodobacteraceae bacterium]|nr:DUF1828 domain-containing protein [Paracoccaceae bacterium]